MPDIPSAKDVVGSAELQPIRNPQQGHLPQAAGGARLPKPSNALQRATENLAGQIAEMDARRIAVATADFDKDLRIKSIELAETERQKEGSEAMGGRERYEEEMQKEYDRLLEIHAGVDKIAAKNSLDEIHASTLGNLIRHENDQARKHQFQTAGVTATAELAKLTRLIPGPDGKHDPEVLTGILKNLEAAYATQIAASDDPLDPASPEGQLSISNLMEATLGTAVKGWIDNALAEENTGLAKNIYNANPDAMTAADNAASLKRIFTIENAINGRNWALKAPQTWHEMKAWSMDHIDKPYYGAMMNFWQTMHNGDRQALSEGRSDLTYEKEQRVVEGQARAIDYLQDNPNHTFLDMYEAPEFSVYRQAGAHGVDILAQSYLRAKRFFTKPEGKVSIENAASSYTRGIINDNPNLTKQDALDIVKHYSSDAVREEDRWSGPLAEEVEKKLIAHVERKAGAQEQTIDYGRRLDELSDNAFAGDLKPTDLADMQGMTPMQKKRAAVLGRINAYAQGVAVPKRELDAYPTVDAVYAKIIFRGMSNADIRANRKYTEILLYHMHPDDAMQAVQSVKDALDGAEDNRQPVIDVAKRLQRELSEEFKGFSKTKKITEFNTLVNIAEEWYGRLGNADKNPTAEDINEMRSMFKSRMDIRNKINYWSIAGPLRTLEAKDMAGRWNNVAVNNISEEKRVLWEDILLKAARSEGSFAVPSMKTEEAKKLILYLEGLKVIYEAPDVPTALRSTALEEMAKKLGHNAVREVMDGGDLEVIKDANIYGFDAWKGFDGFEAWKGFE